MTAKTPFLATVGRLSAAAVLLLTAFLIAPTTTLAASAVSMDQKNRIYAYGIASKLAEAQMRARAECEKRGGADCQPFVSCTQPGHGAIASNKETGEFAGSCGEASTAEANRQALENCDFRAGKANACTIALYFFDNNLTQDPLNLSFYDGRWGGSCSGGTWYKLTMASKKEIKLSICSGTSTGLCKETKGFYSPGATETIFINPTLSSRLTKLGDNEVEWKTPNRRDRLTRCP